MDRYDGLRIVNESITSDNDRERLLATFFFLLGAGYADEPEFGIIMARINDAIAYVDNSERKIDILVDHLYEGKHTDSYYSARGIFETAVEKVSSNIF